jgi:hypothetical protein
MADNYRVTGQRQTVELAGDGRFRDVIEVAFEDQHGNNGTIRVPVAQYTPDNVRQMIEARVEKMHEVHNL